MSYSSQYRATFAVFSRVRIASDRLDSGSFLTRDSAGSADLAGRVRHAVGRQLEATVMPAMIEFGAWSKPEVRLREAEDPRSPLPMPVGQRSGSLPKLGAVA